MQTAEDARNTRDPERVAPYTSDAASPPRPTTSADWQRPTPHHVADDLAAHAARALALSNGFLECPWHASRYDVRSGAMVRGPQGAFKPLAGFVKHTTGARPLTTFPVALRDGAIWLDG